MKYVHSNCGGLIHLQTRTCTKCKKHWSYLGFWLTPKGIRSMREPSDLRVMTKQEEVTTIQRLIRQRVPGGYQVVAIANALPKWPRWARISVTAFIVACIVGPVTWLIVR